jgi:hypothetical protein
MIKSKKKYIRDLKKHYRDSDSDLLNDAWYDISYHKYLVAIWDCTPKPLLIIQKYFWLMLEVLFFIVACILVIPFPKATARITNWVEMHIPDGDSFNF